MDIERLKKGQHLLNQMGVCDELLDKFKNDEANLIGSIDIQSIKVDFVQKLVDLRAQYSKEFDNL